MAEVPRERVGASFSDRLKSVFSGGSSRLRRIRFLVLFALLFFILQRGYVEARSWGDNALNHYLNAVVSARILGVLAPDDGVVAVWTRVSSAWATIDIMKGCEGFEVMVMLLAAVLAFPAPWRSKAAGAAAGAVLIYVLNQVRLVSLYFVAVHRPALFDALHVTFWQSLLVCLTAGFFLLWVRWASRPPRPA